MTAFPAHFPKGILDVGRKNGKSTIDGGLGNYMLTSDGEGGAEVYFCSSNIYVCVSSSSVISLKKETCFGLYKSFTSFLYVVKTL